MFKNNPILLFISKNLFGGALIVLGGFVTLYSVYAFETLTSTPGTAGNQSLGSQILSKATGGGFDRTTDSLEAISETVNGISSGGVTWAGYTTNAYNGNMGGSKGLLDKCDADFSGSKPMTYENYLDLGDNYPFSFNAWMIDGSYNASSIQFGKDGLDYNASYSYAPMCRGWFANTSSYIGPIITSAGYIDLLTCNFSYKIACVYK